MTGPARAPVLVLGGTTEGYKIAEALFNQGQRVVSSFAGRTANPRPPAGEMRVGGFGGVEGLRAYIRENGVRAVIDATHPFASRMGWNAAEACAASGAPLLRFERPPWTPQAGDRWDSVRTWEEAAARLSETSKRAFLALGRQELAAFAALRTVSFVIRTVDRPEPMPPFVSAELILARGPFSYDDERALLTSRGVDTIVCKNSGGSATDAKLKAARDLGLRVIMRQRPLRPDVPRVFTASAALDWLTLTPPAP